MGDTSSLVIVFCFNLILLGVTYWVVLRVVEKLFDIFIKLEQYEKLREKEYNRDDEPE